MNKKNHLGTEKIGKLLFSLALPAIVGQIVNLLYNVVDRIYIGHLPEIGAEALTGVGVTMPLIMLISAFSALIGMGGAPRAAIAMGAKDHDAAERILGNCVTALVIISAVLTGVFLLFSEPLLMMFGASEATLPYALEYMSIYAMGTIFVQLTLGLNSFISTQGFAKTSMLTVVIGAIVNIVLDPILMFGFGMGVGGAALATVISQAISAVFVVCFLSGKHTHLKIHKKYLRPVGAVLAPVFTLGLAPFIMQATESILYIVFNTSLLRYGGDIAVGAMTIITSIKLFMFLPLIGLTQGAQPIISYNFGAGDKHRVKKAIKLLLIAAISYSTFFWMLIMLLPGLFVGIFTPDPALTAYAVWALRVYLCVGFTLGAQIACQQSFIALGNAKVSMFLALLRKIILLIPLILLLPLFMEHQVFAVFLAEPIADGLAVIVTVSLFYFQTKKTLAELPDAVKAAA